LWSEELINHVWALDVQFDEIADGRPVKIVNVTDEFTREALAARRITAAGTEAVLDQIVEERGQAPTSTPATAIQVHPGRTDASSHSTQDCVMSS